MSDPAAVERALHVAAVFVDRSSRGKIEYRGTARSAFLQRMLSNQIEGLEAGQGTRAELLDVKGVVLSDMRLFVYDDHIRADVEPDFTQATIDRLRMFVLRDDVQIEDVSDALALVTVAGPRAAQMLGHTGLDDLPMFAHTDIDVDGVAVTAARTDWTVSPTFDLVLKADQRDALLTALAARGLEKMSAQTFEVAVIEAGVARQGRELVEGILPLEAELLDKAIVEKGCYPGQEVIVRILHRGHTNRTLVALTLDGAEAVAATELHAAGKTIGRITSQAYSAARDAVVALAIVRREHAEPKTTLDVGGRTATVHTLPLKLSV